jgi:hypothetical protein
MLNAVLDVVPGEVLDGWVKVLLNLGHGYQVVA